MGNNTGAIFILYFFIAGLIFNEWLKSIFIDFLWFINSSLRSIEVFIGINFGAFDFVNFVYSMQDSVAPTIVFAIVVAAILLPKSIDVK
jgi:hypothetical protein